MARPGRDTLSRAKMTVTHSELPGTSDGPGGLRRPARSKVSPPFPVYDQWLLPPHVAPPQMCQFPSPRRSVPHPSPSLSNTSPPPHTHSAFPRIGDPGGRLCTAPRHRRAPTNTNCGPCCRSVLPSSRRARGTGPRSHVTARNLRRREDKLGLSRVSSSSPETTLTLVPEAPGPSLSLLACAPSSFLLCPKPAVLRPLLLRCRHRKGPGLCPQEAEERTRYATDSQVDCPGLILAPVLIRRVAWGELLNLSVP